MARRASGSNVSYKELDSDGDGGPASWGLSDGDDDEDLKALKAAAPLAKKRKKAGTKGVGDTYGARRPQRKKPKKTKAPLPVETNEDCESDAAHKDPEDGNSLKRAVDDDSDESESERKASSNEPSAAATESNAAGKVGQHCGSAYGSHFFTWLVRFCGLCGDSQLARRKSLGKKVGSLHPDSLSCVRLEREPHQFLVSEVNEVNNTLVRLQALDDAARAVLAKRSLWTTRSRRTEIDDEDSLRTDHVSRYLSERQAFVARFEKDSAQIAENQISIRRREELEWARIAEEKKRQLQIRVNQTVKQLRDSHGWTSEDTAKLQQGMTEYYVRNPYSLAPETLPDDDRWTAFQVKYRAAIEKEAERARENERYRLRKTLLEQTYAAMTRSLEAELDFVPSWTHVSYQSPVVTFLRATPTPGQDETSYDPEALRATLLAAAKQHVQDARVEAIRSIVATHLDIPVNQLSMKRDDYPTDVYDEAFFQKIPNRFAVTSGQPRTFQQLEKQINANPWGRKFRRNLPQWRRATRHVLLAAGKEASSDLDEVDALGASFAWQNGLEAIRTQRYTWSVMVLINQGPRGLRLSDLKDINIVYTPIKGKGKEKALDTSDDEGNPLRRKKIMDDSEDDSSSDDSSSDDSDA